METKKSFRYIGMLTASAILSSPLIVLSSNVSLVQANPLKLNSSDLAFCSQSVASYAKAVQSSSSNTSSDSFGGSIGIPIDGLPFSLGANTATSNSSSRQYMENIANQSKSRNCDELLRQYGLVTIAEIQANASVAIARLQTEAQKYDSDTQRVIASLQLEAVKDTNTTSRDIAKDTNITALKIAESTNTASTTNTIVGAIGQVLTTAIATSNNQQPQQPPSVATTTSIQGDSTDPIRSMGFTPTNCNPSSAIIAIGSQGYCVQPDRGLQSGMKYAYNSQTNSLSLLSVPSVNPPTVTTPPSGVTDSRIALIQSWGFTLSRCSSTTAKISIDGQNALCVVPTNGLKPGQRYSYNSATGSFKRIPSATPVTNTVRTPQQVPPVRTNNGGNGF